MQKNTMKGLERLGDSLATLKGKYIKKIELEVQLTLNDLIVWNIINDNFHF